MCALPILTFIFHFHALEKEMAPHSSTLAWRIPGMGEPGGLPSIGLHRVALGNPTDRGAWQATVHRVAKSRTQLSTHACVHLGAGTVVGVKTHPIPSLETLLGQRLRWEVLQ